MGILLSELTATCPKPVCNSYQTFAPYADRVRSLPPPPPHFLFFSFSIFVSISIFISISFISFTSSSRSFSSGVPPRLIE